MSPVTALYLIASDAALRTAIAEQLSVAEPAGTPLHEMENFPSSFSVEPAAIILDATVANRNALGVLRSLSAEARKPKIFLLGELAADLSTEEDTLLIESFAKPLRLGHLLARIQFYFQATRMQAGPLVFGCFRLEPFLRQIVVESTGSIIRLTEKETHLLEYLGRSIEPVTREELLAAIWGYDSHIDTHTLETHIYHLRRKLDPQNGETSAIVAKQGGYHLGTAQEK